MNEIDKLTTILQSCLKAKLVFALLYHSIPSESAVQVYVPHDDQVAESSTLIAKSRQL